MTVCCSLIFHTWPFVAFFLFSLKYPILYFILGSDTEDEMSDTNQTEQRSNGNLFFFFSYIFGFLTCKEKIKKFFDSTMYLSSLSLQ